MVANHHELRGFSAPAKQSSDRSFGLIVGSILLLIAAYNWWGGGKIAYPFAGAAVFLLLSALVMPRILAPINFLWTRLGILLGKIMHPLILGALFYLVVTPIGLIARLSGKDFLRLRLDSKAQTYWISRVPPGPSPESISEQF